jgi:predicted aspartyl protease
MPAASPCVKFLIDTGAPCTIITYRDASQFNINISTLRRHSGKITGVTEYGLKGGVVPCVISNCDIVLDVEDSDCKNFSTTMDKLLIFPEGRELSTISLLGIDFLKNYIIRFDTDSVTLELCS